MSDAGCPGRRPRARNARGTRGAARALSALSVACSVSNPARSEHELYEGPNFYESDDPRASRAPLQSQEPVAGTDFLVALLEDGSVATSCGSGARVLDSPASPEALGAECPAISRSSISSFTFEPRANPSGIGLIAFSGGTFFYPDEANGLRSDLTGDDWHISGTVAGPSGFGLFFSGCPLLDASAYGGIAFSLWGRLEPPGSLAFFVGSAGDQVASAWLNAHKASAADADEPPNLGRCLPRGQRYDGSCREPRIGLPVSETPTSIQVRWRDLMNGCPEPSVDSAEISSIAWYFPPAASAYAVDLHLDDLRFAELDVR